MYAQVEKSKDNKGKPLANSVVQSKSNKKQGFGFVDRQSEVISQRKLQEFADKSLASDPMQRLAIGFTPTNAWLGANVRGNYGYQGAAAGQGAGQGFTDGDKTNVYNTNTALLPALNQNHKAWQQVSDEDGDRLYSRAGANWVTPEIDHIVESANGGSNDRRNARVLSFNENRDPATSRPNNAGRMVRTYDPIRIRVGANSQMYNEGDHLTTNAVNNLLIHANGVGGGYAGATAGDITNGDWNTVLGTNPGGVYFGANGVDIRNN